MFEILQRRELNASVTWLSLKAPLIANKAQAGQFVIVRATERGERIPLTIAGCDKAVGAIEIVFQVVGGATMELDRLRVGEALADVTGPLGNPTALDGLRAVAVVAGGVGCAIALPVARALKERGANVTSIVGFREKGLVILEEEFRAVSDRFFLTTDDGSYGERGNVTAVLSRLLPEGRFDEVITIGPLPMMKFVAKCTLPFGVKTVCSMNPIMIDGTGMCGCCRVTVDGQVKFACVDGPDFDGHKIDFDETIARAATYKEFEQRRRAEHKCRLEGMNNG